MLTKVMFQYKDKRPHSNTKTTFYKVLASAASTTKQSTRVELPYIDREGGRETYRPQKKKNRKKQNRRTIIRHARIPHSKTRHNMQCKFCKFYKVKAKGEMGMSGSKLAYYVHGFSIHSRPEEYLFAILFAY